MCNNTAAKFPLGRVLITRIAHAALEPHDIFAALARHQRGDWGDVPSEDRSANERALAEGSRLLSAYHSEGRRVTFWVITEADRSVTTVLLPLEY